MLPRNEGRVGSFLITGAVTPIPRMVVGCMLFGQAPARAHATTHRSLHLVMAVESPDERGRHDICATRRHCRVGMTYRTRQQIVGGTAVYVNTVTLPVAASIPVVTARTDQEPLPQDGGTYQ